MNLYISIYIYIYIYTHTHTHIAHTRAPHTHTHTHTHTHFYKPAKRNCPCVVYLQRYVYTCTYIHIYIYIYMFQHMLSTCMCIYAHLSAIVSVYYKHMSKEKITKEQTKKKAPSFQEAFLKLSSARSSIQSNNSLLPKDCAFIKVCVSRSVSISISKSHITYDINTWHIC